MKSVVTQLLNYFLKNYVGVLTRPFFVSLALIHFDNMYQKFSCGLICFLRSSCSLPAVFDSFDAPNTNVLLRTYARNAKTRVKAGLRKMQHEMHLPINHHRVLRPNHLLSLGISKKELCLEFQMQDKVLSLGM